MNKNRFQHQAIFALIASTILLTPLSSSSSYDGGSGYSSGGSDFGGGSSGGDGNGGDW